MEAGNENSKETKKYENMGKQIVKTQGMLSLGEW